MRFSLNMLSIFVATSLLSSCQVEIVSFDGNSESTTSSFSNASFIQSPPVVDRCATAASEKDSSLTVEWQAPVERENGEALFYYEIGGYLVEYKKQTDEKFCAKTLVVSADKSIIEITELEATDYTVRVSAFDVNGLYSTFSNSIVVSAN